MEWVQQHYDGLYLDAVESDGCFARQSAEWLNDGLQPQQPYALPVPAATCTHANTHTHQQPSQ